MQDIRLPKQLFYCDLTVGRRERGRTKLNFKDTLKQSLQKSGIGTYNWETMTANKLEWRTAVYRGTQLYETERTAR